MDTTTNKQIHLAAGCFWGAEKYLHGLRGVIDTEVGYANGNTPHPTYEQVCTQTTGYAETVAVTYDPAVMPLAKLLRLYFGAIDPTSVNKQGGDIGDQYRTGIYYTDPADLPIIAAEIESLAATLTDKVAVEVRPLESYCPAEEYHQRYLWKNPGGYCHISDAMCKAAWAASTED
jgi:peptide methionine sulfoxide reductase msrA/msrB